MQTETVTWRELPHDGMPDADESLHLAIQRLDDGSVEVWGGWWSGEHWVDDATGDRIERGGDRRVVAWAPQMAGPAVGARTAPAALATT